MGYLVMMNAGIEMNVLIAEKVFGHKFTGELHKGLEIVILPSGEWDYLPAYSTDIDAAWEVVMKIPMSVYAPGASVAYGEYGNGSESWRAEARLPEAHYTRSFVEEAATAPHAICLAALKAISS